MSFKACNAIMLQEPEVRLHAGTDKVPRHADGHVQQPGTLRWVLSKGQVGPIPARGHLLLVGEAGVEQAHGEAHVVGVLHLLPEELLLAVPAEGGAVLRQALLHLPFLCLCAAAGALHVPLQHEGAPTAEVSTRIS